MLKEFDQTAWGIRFVENAFANALGSKCFVRCVIAGLLVVAILIVTSPAAAQIIEPPYDSFYTFTDLGSVPGLPPSYGGLTFLLNEPDTLLIGGNANTSSGLLYAIEVVRDDSNHVVGFVGSATFFADAAYNDGGVVYGPGDVLFLSRWPVNELGQTKFGSTITDKIIDLEALGVVYSHAAVNFVPLGFPGEGQMKLVSWVGGEWYTAYFSPDGSGTYNVDSVSYETTIIGGPEGFIYVAPGSPLFPDFNSMLVSEWSGNEVVAYELDTNGNPDPSSRVSFITGLNGAEGATIDPLTGDFLFSTFGGGDRVIVVKGFAVQGTFEAPQSEMPTLIELKQNDPNPFSRYTEIQFSLHHSSYATLKVFNLLGQEIATLVDHQLPAGTNTITWDGSNFTSGVYFYRLEACDFVTVKKLMLLK